MAARTTPQFRDDRLRLTVSGEVLERWHTLSYYNIPNESILTVSVQMGWHPNYLKTLTGKIITLVVHNDFSLRALKDQIQERENIPPHAQAIIHAGKQLKNDEATMSDYAIQADTTLHLVLRLSGSEVKDVFVRVLKRIISLKVCLFVKDIKRLIKYHEGIHEDEQILMYAGKELEDNQSKDIEAGSTIDLVVRPAYNARLFFKVSNGETVGITVQTSDTIAEIRSKILDMNGIMLPTQVSIELQEIFQSPNFWPHPLIRDIAN